MSRRVVASLLALVAVVASPAGTRAAAAQGRAPRRPNIVWISAEDLSPRLGAYGDTVARTPTVDRLAREGQRFTRAFATAAICAPSRSAIITGMHQNAIGTMHMRTTEREPAELPGPYLAVPPHHVKAFTEYLRAAGYHTTNDSKTDYQFAPVTDSRQPFSAWDSSGPGAHWRQRRDPAQPFFAVFNYVGTHESRVWADAPENRGTALVTDPARVAVPPYYPDTRPVREELARQYDNVAAMDRWAGGILRQLEEDGLADNTVVFFWTDHGDGLPRAKRWLYDSGLRVPLVIRWPGALRPGSVNEELVSFLDLAPTVLAMAGVAAPTHLQGRVIAGPARGAEPAFVFGGRDRVDQSYDMVRSARDRRFLYVRNFHPELPYVLTVPYRNRSATMQELYRLHDEGRLDAVQALWMRPRRPPEELYDTARDPHQVRDLAADPAQRERLLRMRGAVAAWMRDVGDQALAPESEMAERMWPGGRQPVTARPVVLPRRATTLSGDSTIVLPRGSEVAIYVATQGASVEYAADTGGAPRWRLYTGPIAIDRTTTIRARAVRYGYAPSAETRVTVQVSAP